MKLKVNGLTVCPLLIVGEMEQWPSHQVQTFPYIEIELVMLMVVEYENVIQPRDHSHDLDFDCSDWLNRSKVIHYDVHYPAYDKVVHLDLEQVLNNFLEPNHVDHQ